MKAAMLSIRPQWCELVANGKKTIEVRKTRPKLETPFKCYIYQTKTGKVGTGLFTRDGEIMGRSIKNGKVIGEFVCDRVTNLFADSRLWLDEKAVVQTCLTGNLIREYANGKEAIYGWHISALQIYDKPKGLSEFTPMCRYREDDGCCQHKKVACGFQEADYNQDGSLNLVECGRKLTRPPQSWGYVEATE